MGKLYQLLEDHYQEMVDIRRYLHENPELSFQEVLTPKYIAKFHQELGHDVRVNVGGRGVVATLKGKRPGRTVALRADFDALPIQEEGDKPYLSKVQGIMHACGHDGHTASLLVLAKVLNQLRDEFEGTIVFIHQHAEEMAPGGAIAMIEDGCLDGVEMIFGGHLWAIEPLGDILYHTGPFMAASDSFEINIQGRGGHGSQPHLTKDAVVIGSQLVTNLQQIVARRVDPLDLAVLSVGSFEAINAFNVIADTAKLKGTVRTFREEVRNLMEQEIERIVKGTCLTAGVEYQLSYERGYPAVDNPKEPTQFLVDIARSVPGVNQVREVAPVMGGEDFSYYLQHVPGTFFFTGAKSPQWDVVYPHHHPKFDIAEEALLISAKTLGAAALTFLQLK